MQHRSHAIVAIKMFGTMKEQLHFSLNYCRKKAMANKFHVFKNFFFFFLVLNMFEPFEHYSYRASPNTMEIDFCFPENFPCPAYHSVSVCVSLCVSMCACTQVFTFQ